MTADTHAIGLLSAEIHSESSLLEKEKEALDAVNQDFSGMDDPDPIKLHPFSRGSNHQNPRTCLADYEVRSATKTSVVRLSDIEYDPEAKDVLNQLRHHLDSMQNNVKGLDHIEQSLSSSQAALDAFNWRLLREAHYRQIYGLDEVL